MDNKFPIQIKSSKLDSGFTCIQMITEFYGRSITIPKLYNTLGRFQENSSLKNIIEVAEKIGYETLPTKLSVERLVDFAEHPIILHWNQNHFVVLFDIKKTNVPGGDSFRFFIADPLIGLVKLDQNQFEKSWLSEEQLGIEKKGVALLLMPSPGLNQVDSDDNATESNLDTELLGRVESMLEKEKRLPSNAQIIRNLAIDQWRSLKLFAKRGKVIASQEIATERWETCSSCEYLLYDETNPETNKKDGRCVHCGCFMSIKVHFSSSKCPIGVWGESLNE